MVLSFTEDYLVIKDDCGWMNGQIDERKEKVIHSYILSHHVLFYNLELTINLIQ